MSGILDLIQPDKFEFGIPAIFAFCALCAVFQSLTWKYAKKKRLDPEVVGGFFQVIGTIYAVLMGLIVYDATDRYSNAHDDVVNESKSLTSIFILSGQIKQNGIGESLRKMTKGYVDEVVSGDWNHLHDETANKKARKIIRDINTRILAIYPENKNEEMVLPMLAQASMDAWRFRMSRFDRSRHNIPTSEWLFLLAGAIITIVSSYFYYLECRRSQALLTLLTSFIIGSSLYAIFMFSEPYKGDFMVSKEPFEIAQRIMDGSYFNEGELENID